ncbi:MAG: tetratricopeptide repeat protein, partial [Chloroflexaceae bacterium]|nr:tetratricopeptide repeat protein [Chloroflexaceae bacterium]
AEEAESLAASRRADLLFWGEVPSGALANEASLRPRLVYMPAGSYAPNVWNNYLGRFSTPRHMALTNQPINGVVVLPRLVQALYHYSIGRSDGAFDALGALLDDYPALADELPRSLRGNVLWARGDYGPALNEYQLALNQATTERGKLLNNMGAIQMDAGMGEAAGTLAEAALVQNGQPLSELHMNLALLGLAQSHTNDAIQELELARQTSNVAPLHLALSEAYRELGRLDDAELALRSAENRVNDDVNGTPQTMRELLRQHLEAANIEQRALLDLARQVGAQGPLVWELETLPALPTGSLDNAIYQMRSAMQASETLVNNWRDRATSDDIATGSISLVARGQRNQIDTELKRQRYHMALLLATASQSEYHREPGFFTRVRRWFQPNSDPLNEASSLLQGIINADANNLPARIALGQVLRLQNRPAEAQQLYDQIIAERPDRPEGYFGSGMLALNSGNRAQAINRFNQALAVQDSFFPAHLQLARAAEAAGDWPNAVRHYEYLAARRQKTPDMLALAAALRQSGPAGYPRAQDILNRIAENGSDAEKSQALVELGRIDRDASQLDAAVQHFESARRSDSRSSAAAFELGQTLAMQGSSEAARDAYRAAIDNDAGNMRARLALATLYQNNLRQPQEARREFRAALDSNPTNAGDLLPIGYGLLINDDAEGASDAFRRATEQQPGNGQAHHGMAQALIALGRYDAAEVAAQRTLELTANVPGDAARILRAAALVSLGDCARLEGRSADAANFYNQALELDTVQVDAMLGLGQLDTSDGNWAVALSRFERAMSFPAGPTSARANFWLADALLRQNPPALPRAADHYTKALELRANFPEALLGLAQVQYAQNNREAAFTSLDQAFAMRPAYAEGQLFRGRMLEEGGDVRGALEAYSAAISANGRLGQSYYWRGRLYVSQNELDRGVSDLLEAVRLQPNFPEAHYVLGRAYGAKGRDQVGNARTYLQRAIDVAGGTYPEAQFALASLEAEAGNRDGAIALFQAVTRAGNPDLANKAQTEIDRLR